MSSWLQASGMWPDGIVAKFELELGRGHLYTTVFQEGWGSSPGRHDLILSYKMIGKGIWFWISGSLSAQRGRFAFFFFFIVNIKSSVFLGKRQNRGLCVRWLNYGPISRKRMDQRASPKDLWKFPGFWEVKTSLLYSSNLLWKWPEMTPCFKNVSPPPKSVSRQASGSRKAQPPLHSVKCT